MSSCAGLYLYSESEASQGKLKKMKKELAVLVIHGIGRQDENFADELKEGVSAELERLGRDPESVAWQTIFWDDILSPAQDAYLQSAFDSNELRAKRTRSFLSVSYTHLTLPTICSV